MNSMQAVQARLVDENKSLATERSRLSDVMANIQRMHNDLEKFNDGDRRRIETQLQAVEAQAYVEPSPMETNLIVDSV